MYIYKCKQQLYRLAPLSVIPFNCSKPYIQPIRKSLCMFVRHRITLHTTIFCSHCCCILLIKKPTTKTNGFSIFIRFICIKKCVNIQICVGPLMMIVLGCSCATILFWAFFYLFLSLYLLSTSLSFFKKKNYKKYQYLLLGFSLF